jgi:hypothetical protein
MLAVLTIASAAGTGSACDAGVRAAEAPGELAPTVRVSGVGWITWNHEPDAQYYAVYKGRMPAAQDWVFGHVCLSGPVTATWSADMALPGRGELYYYVVSKGNASGEGPLGFATDGTPRPDPLPCVDTDGDRVADPIDNCPLFGNPKQVDTDFDLLGDACDDDDDNDGLTDGEEYLLGTNSLDWDTDGDGVGDGDEVLYWGSDPLSTDTDGDGLDDGEDNCPVAFNAGQTDADTDGAGDACDNCPAIPNHDQLDYDQDEMGDVCDNCPYVSNQDQIDDNHNGVGDACERVSLTEVLDSGGLECWGTRVGIDAASVGQVAAGRLAGSTAGAEVGFVNGAADE